MNKLTALFFITYLFSTSILWGQAKPVVEESPVELSKELKQKLDEIKTITPENYIAQIDGARDYLERYIVYKRGVCTGDFSTIILKDNQLKHTSEEIRSLTPAEKNLCFGELKTIQTIFINNMYVARLAYLKSLHARELKKLDATRAKSIEDLNRRFKTKEY